ncbi:unnamed protein product [Adineta steineri]|uniref:Ankyrin repeat-containing protein n=1 Tax=Adineta steineri TaxID=433720 RepID=A0A813ZIE7_9BILA|nr:unnamed protein product [Adineta steineri]CAF1478865.1 unnamed protein product [Adineta steineri]
MPPKTDRFYKNHLYKILSNPSNYSDTTLQELNSLLHEQPDLVDFTHPIEGSYYHVICRNSHSQDNIGFRMIYALSNAGADPNVTDGMGNTPLHEAIIQTFDDNSFDLIQALFRVGVDPRIVNHEGKTADVYIKNKPQLKAFYKAYGEGIWAAIETCNIQECERLMTGFIKVDCKHNSNKTLLDKACDLNCQSIIDILANYQITTEFVHSILACDWDRASLIYEHDKNSLQIYPLDTIHRLTDVRRYSKSLLEYCLDTQCSKPFEMLFHSSIIKYDVNILCTDGLPFFFHCFDEFITYNIRDNILLNSNMSMKSAKGETILFHLIYLYSLKENTEYLKIFSNIIYKNPLLLTQRNELEQTIVDIIESTQSISMHNKLRPFYDIIMNLLISQLKNDKFIEQFILNNFGYYLLIFCKNKTLLMTRYVYKLLRSLKLYRSLPVLMFNFLQTIIENNFEKLKLILKLQPNIYSTKDSFGRTCVHLAVLHQKYDILKFLCNKYKTIINMKDNLNRTSFHYACMMNDQISMEILEQVHAKQLNDCLNFSPNDYLLNHELHFERFSSRNFPEHELQRKSIAISNYLKIAFYSKFKQAIEKNSIDEIKLLNNELIQMGFHLKDFDPNSSLNDYVQGERYIPFLFLAFEYRAIPAIKCLLQLGLPIIGQIAISISKMNNKSLWMPFCRRLGDLQCLDIIDIIAGLEDDVELKDAFKQKPVPIEIIIHENSIKTEQHKQQQQQQQQQLRHSNWEKLSKAEKLIKFFKGHQQNQDIKSKTDAIRY